MAYIPPELFCKIPLSLHKKIEHYLSHPVADLVKTLFKDWRAIFVENTNRDYVLSAKWRASELKVYKSIQEKLYRQMKLDMKFGTNDRKIYRDQLAEKRFENIVTKTMLDVKDNYHPVSRNPRCLQGRKIRWQRDLPRDRELYHMEYAVGLYEKPALRESGVRKAIPYDGVTYDFPTHRYFPGYACRVYKKKEVLFKFVQGLNPKAKKSWNKKTLLQSIYPNLRW